MDIAGRGGPFENVALRRLASPWLGPLLAAATAAMGWALLDRLPERVPTHWGADGRPNGWMSPLAAVAFAPLLIAVMWAFLLGIATVVPGAREEGTERRAYLLLCNSLLLFLAVVQGLVLGGAVGAPVDAPALTMPFLGLLFVLIGLLMPYLPNGGVNLPVQDPEYQRRLSLFMRPVFVWGGVLIAAVELLVPGPTGTWLAVGLIVVVSILPLGYIGLRPPPVRRPPGGWRGTRASEGDRTP